ncbi:hypothetical protein J6590_008464 [Homalodisca vitripennis]|nr:hypothetical protein J6590_008464 [Homalodisca vitripennis]
MHNYGGRLEGARRGRMALFIPRRKLGAGEPPHRKFWHLKYVTVVQLLQSRPYAVSLPLTLCYGTCQLWHLKYVTTVQLLQSRSDAASLALPLCYDTCQFWHLKYVITV